MVFLECALSRVVDEIDLTRWMKKKIRRALRESELPVRLEASSVKGGGLPPVLFLETYGLEHVSIPAWFCDAPFPEMVR